MRDIMLDRYKIEREQEWREWVDKIPYIKFDSEWDVKIIPPFSGAMARFLVRYKGKDVSIYLDCFESLGCWNGPYWEVYPYNDDVGRCDIDDTDELLSMIRHTINENN